MNKMTKKLTISAMIIAVYVVIMYFTQSFAFGQYQIRIATSLYALAGINPFLILPLGLANMLSNTVMGGLGIFDIVGGLAVGLATAGGCYLLRKIHWTLVAVAIIVLPALIVPIWLSGIIGVPYHILVISLGIGQIIPGIVGAVLLKSMEKPMNKILEV